MACGCSGSGGWQAQGYVPATNVQDASYFWQPPDEDASSDEPEPGTARWSAETGTTRTPEN